MSVADDMIAKALDVIAAIQGDTTIEYGGNRDGTGTWTALTDAVFQKDDATGEYEDGHRAEGSRVSATLLTTAASASLTIDTFVRIGGSGGDIYTVTGGPDGTSHKAYDLERFEVDRHRRDRGRFA